MEELRQAGLDEEGVRGMRKLYDEVRAEEDRAKEKREKEVATALAEGTPRPSQTASALKIGGLAHGVISRLLITLTLMHEVCLLPLTFTPF